MRSKLRLLMWVFQVTKMVTGHIVSAVSGVQGQLSSSKNRSAGDGLVSWFLGSPDCMDLISVVYYGSSDILLACNHLKESVPIFECNLNWIIKCYCRVLLVQI